MSSSRENRPQPRPCSLIGRQAEAQPFHLGFETAHPQARLGEPFEEMRRTPRADQAEKIRAALDGEIGCGEIRIKRGMGPCETLAGFSLPGAIHQGGVADGSVN